MKFILVILALSAAVVCGKTFSEKPVTLLDLLEDESVSGSRIISGKPAAPGQFPWQVVNRFRKGSGTSFCGGALICDNWVLTAAHCAQGASNFTIYLGSVNQSAAIEPGRVVIQSTEAYVHENYSAFTLSNDVALIKLPKKLTSRVRRIQPIRLSRDFTGANVNVNVSGWGKTSDGSLTVSPTLNYVTLRSISNNECSQHYGSVIKSSTICCKGNPQHSTCNGDSGGPLVQLKANGRYEHIGVVSFVSSAGCASGAPSGYARTQNFFSWIEKKIGGSCKLL